MRPIELDDAGVAFFYSRIKTVPSGCHEWLGKRRVAGYGIYRDWYAHRIAYTLAKGPIPDGLFVCHACDNKICVNPEHLWVGTNSDNMRDMLDKGLKPIVYKIHCLRGHRLTPDNVYITPSGDRQCRACLKIHKRAFVARQSARQFILGKQEWR